MPPFGFVTVALLALASATSCCNAFVAGPRHAVTASTRRSLSNPYSRLTSMSNGSDGSASPSKMERFAASLSKSAAVKISRRYKESGPLGDGTSPINLITLIRVGIPAVLGGVIATAAFPGLALFLGSIMNDAGVFSVLSQDSGQFVQNFLSVSSLLFSILVGQT